ncbi:MAG: acyl-CoA synthetase [Rhodospirillaceae bacterium]|nr:acyl-CoA synthetase [Rhodospirillaceae bacterium]
MAKPPSRRPGSSPSPKASPGGGAFSRILLVSLAIFVALMFLPTVIFLVFAMLPTAVAYMVDRSSEKYEWVCVGGLNFAGASPFLLNLWTGRHTIDAAVSQLTDVFSLMAIFGAAGLGWMLFIALPPVVGVFMQFSAQRRITTLKTTQTQLVQTWGQEVAKPKG